MSASDASPIPPPPAKAAKRTRPAMGSHGVARVLGLAAVNSIGFIGIAACTVFGWAAISQRSAALLESAMTPQLAEVYMPMVNPLLGIQSIKLLNASHMYLIAVIVAALALLTVVDALLEMCVEYVADRAMISTALVAEMETGDYDIAITNAGFSHRIKYAANPSDSKRAPPKK